MSNFVVWTTAVANRQLRNLRGETRRNAKQAMDRLERRGCQAADYRLEGYEVERLCVIDLGRDWRMIVAFPQTDEVAVILVGRHIERRPEVDVYRRLYESLGIELPTIAQRKGHPPCCPTGKAPVDREVVDRFVARERELRRRARGRHAAPKPQDPVSGVVLRHAHGKAVAGENQARGTYNARRC